MRIGKTYKVTLEDKIVTGECLATLKDGVLIGNTFVEYIHIEGVEVLGYIRKVLNKPLSRIGTPRPV